MSQIKSSSVLLLDAAGESRATLEHSLEQHGYDVCSVEDEQSALEALHNQEFSFVLCDLEFSDINSIQFLQKSTELDSNSIVLAMAASKNREAGLNAIAAGAYDSLTKPLSPDELVFTLKKIEQKEGLKSKSPRPRNDKTKRYNFSNIIAKSSSMLEIFEQVKRLSNFKTTILISGESGTGKELLARAIHFNSPRRKQAFIPINCGAIPENLMESELFGHRKGAFTDATRDKKGLFEEANGGTIFLDEIGELPLHLQVKLLRVLQEQELRPVGEEEPISIDVRVLAATHRNLENDVMTGRFREDLFYRLNVVSLEIPPLRKRVEDIPVLTEHFIKKYNKRLGLEIEGIADQALQNLMQYQWRGNVRELENSIERAMVLSDSSTLQAEVFSENVRQGSKTEEDGGPQIEIDGDDLSVKKRVRNLETALILKALRKTGGNRTHAAKLLEISHRTLLYKLKEYGLKEVEK